MFLIFQQHIILFPQPLENTELNEPSCHPFSSSLPSFQNPQGHGNCLPEVKGSCPILLLFSPLHLKEVSHDVSCSWVFFLHTLTPFGPGMKPGECSSVTLSINITIHASKWGLFTYRRENNLEQVSFQPSANWVKLV